MPVHFKARETESTIPPIQLKISKIENEYITAKSSNATVNDVEMTMCELSKLIQKSVANKQRKIHLTIQVTDFFSDTNIISQIETCCKIFLQITHTTFQYI